MAWTSAEENLIVADLFFENRRFACFEVSAVDMHEYPAFVADVLDAARLFVGALDGHAVCVFALEIIIEKGVVELALCATACCDVFDGCGLIGIVTQLCQVYYVCAAVAHFSATVIENKTPSEGCVASFGVGHLCHRSQPEIPVDSFRFGHGGVLASVVYNLQMMPLGAWQVYDHALEFSDTTVLNEFGGKPCSFARAFVAASLEDAAVTLDGFFEDFTLSDGVYEGFFAVDVFSCFCGGD